MRTIIFDFGNVIAFFDHQRAIARLTKYTDMPPVELTLQLYGSMIEDQYERGKLTTAEYVRLAKLNGRLQCSDDDFLSVFVDIFTKNSEVCELIPRLRPRYRVMLASNTNDAHYRKFTTQFADVLGPAHFDILCASHIGGCRKPEADYFQYCQTHAKADPADCLFVDDLAANVEAAKRWGWHGIVYQPGDELTVKLRAAGVEF